MGGSDPRPCACAFPRVVFRKPPLTGSTRTVSELCVLDVVASLPRGTYQKLCSAQFSTRGSRVYRWRRTSPMSAETLGVGMRSERSTGIGGSVMSERCPTFWCYTSAPTSAPQCRFWRWGVRLLGYWTTGDCLPRHFCRLIPSTRAKRKPQQRVWSALLRGGCGAGRRERTLLGAEDAASRDLWRVWSGPRCSALGWLRANGQWTRMWQAVIIASMWRSGWLENKQLHGYFCTYAAPSPTICNSPLRTNR